MKTTNTAPALYAVRKNCWRLPIMALGLTATAGAWAQSPGDALEEIIVTAEKREADVQKTAISIAVVGGEQLREQALTRPSQVLENIPAVTVQPLPQGANVFIRGVGSNGDTNSIDPAVSITFDGVYSGRAETVLAGSMYDVARVEILRGPQGTLYGRNAVGGSVNIVSNEPLLGRFETLANMQVGNYSLAHLDAAVNLPLGDTMAFRLSGLRETRDPYYTTGGYESNLTGYRGKFAWTPNSDLKIGLTADIFRSSGGSATTVPYQTSNPVLTATGAPTTVTIGAGNPRFAADTYVVDWYCQSNVAGYSGVYPSSLGGCAGTKGGVTYTRHSTSDPWWVDPDHPADVIQQEFRTFYGQMDWDLHWSTLTFLPSYSDSTRSVKTNLFAGTSILNANGLAVLTYANPYTEKQYTGELRLASPGSSAMKWVGGLFYLHSDNVNETVVPNAFNANTGYRTYNGPRPTISEGIFAQLTYPIVEQFRVTGGARYTKDRKSMAVGIQTSASYVPPGATTALIPVDYDSGLIYGGKFDSSATTWKAGVEYDLLKESMLYAQVSTGYEAGGFVTASIPAKTYEPEKLTAIEVGAKNRFLEDTLQLNFAAYYYRYKNYQLQYSVPGNGQPNPICSDPVIAAALAARNGAGNICNSAGNGQSSSPTGSTPSPAANQGAQYVANAQTGTNKGVELESAWLFTPQDQLGLNIAYMNARYGIIATGNANIDADSNQVTTGTPKWVETVSVQHTFTFANQGSLSVRGQTRLSSGYYDAVDRTRAGSYQGSFHRSEAQVTYKFPDEHWTTNFWIRNIENDAQITNSGPNQRVYINDPRTYGINVSAKF